MLVKPWFVLLSVVPFVLLDAIIVSGRVFWLFARPDALHDGGQLAVLSVVPTLSRVGRRSSVLRVVRCPL